MDAAGSGSNYRKAVIIRYPPAANSLYRREITYTLALFRRY
jgi:hypothetical protein